jgi:DNA-binding transcriptional ArsR family regulator
MSPRVIAALVILVVGVPIAFVLDRNSWRKRRREDLVRLIEEGDWRYISAALKELRRRGENIDVFVPCVLRLMLDEFSATRTAGKLALKDHFPEIAKEISTFEATGSEEKRVAILEPLLRRYGITPEKKG